MNKTSIIVAAAAAVLAVAGCKGKTTDVSAARDEFNASLDELMSEYRTAAGSIASDETLSDEQKDERAQAVADSVMEVYKQICLDAVKANKDNEVGVEALSQVRYSLSPDELEAALGTLSAKMRQDSVAIGIAEGLAAKKKTAEGQMFTDFTVVQDPDDPAGSTVSLSDYVGKGKYVLVDFWASWCGPCKAEIPNIADVYAKYGGDDFDVLSVAVWDKPEASVKAAGELGIVWNKIINAQQIPTDAYGIDGIPEIILFAPDGKILARGLREAQIEKTVAEHVQPKR